MKKIIALLSFMLIICGVSAQSYYTIYGTVINQVTNKPMQAASVFAQNTTLGTVTDADGNFKLQLPSGGYDIVFTYTGFRTESKRVTNADAAEKINILLNENEKMLETVSVIASNEVMDGLAKYGTFFNEQFIGKSPSSSFCSIKNPDALHFFFSKKKNRLKVTATDVLIISNNKLGYNIKYNLDSFTYEYKTDMSIYSRYPLYEEMQGDSLQINQWIANRNEVYKGSLLHFMRSLYNKNLSQNGFEVQFIVKGNKGETAIKLSNPYEALHVEKDDSTQTVDITPNQQNVGILFLPQKPNEAYLSENPSEPKDFQFSMLTFKPDNGIVIEQNGYFYDQNDVLTSGYWVWNKVAEQLPYNFIAKKE